MLRSNHRLAVLTLLILILTAGRSFAQSFQILTSFDDSSGTGLAPNGALAISGSTLYGLTEGGGANDVGTVFSLPVTGGTPTILGSFGGASPNGADPNSGSVTLVGSTLYGLTEYGGANGLGTIFSVPATGGPITTMYSFQGQNDGANPVGNLTLSGSTLYGDAIYGFGSLPNGLPFAGGIFGIPVGGITPTVLQTFNGTAVSDPASNLTLGGSTFYGMSNDGPNGHGTIYSVPVGGGAPTVLSSLATDQIPAGDLILAGSTLFGMTINSATDGGTIFSIPDTGGTPTILHVFADGEFPIGSLVLSGSTLYGATQLGGADGDGTIFGIPVTGGTLTTLVSFDGTNGATPEGSLTLGGSKLYGATAFGGANDEGTVFAITLPTPEPSSLALLGLGAAALGAMALRRKAARRAA
jgi:uncharacterized repeat protein (TIGR03803 family)